MDTRLPLAGEFARFADITDRRIIFNAVMVPIVERELRELWLRHQVHTGKCKSTGAGCNELVKSKLRTKVRLKWRKR